MILGIDGSSMLVTAYHGNLPASIRFEKDEEKKKEHYHEILHASDGTYTNAIHTMLTTILKIVKEQKPEYMVVAFDKTRNTFRRRMYEEYKGTRKETPVPLKEQFILMEQLLSDIGIKVLVSDEYEADDLIGSFLRQYGSNEHTSYFMTKDHDYIQLIDSNTRGWFVQNTKEDAEKLINAYAAEFGGAGGFNFNIPAKVFEFTPQIIEEEFGHRPEQIIDVKAIGGDPSDNIPGVKGVSAETAVKLLSEYQNLEQLYETIEQCADEKEEKALAAFWKETLGISRSPIKLLKEQKDMAFLSRDLATIRVDVPLDFTLEDCRCQINEEVLKTYCERLELKTILNTL